MNFIPCRDIFKISILGDKMNVTSPKMLAQAIKDARKQRNLTQRETAASMGMKQSTVSEFENHPVRGLAWIRSLSCLPLWTLSFRS
jgi:DNA-binding XRE family transcriptional regulator